MPLTLMWFYFLLNNFFLDFGGGWGIWRVDPLPSLFSIQNRSLQMEEGGAGSKAGVTMVRMSLKNELFSSVVSSRPESQDLLSAWTFLPLFSLVLPLPPSLLSSPITYSPEVLGVYTLCVPVIEPETCGRMRH